LFLSPQADGPIKFNTNPDGTQNIMNLSRFGRSFSIIKVPYSFKLLMQELQVMNVQMRIITEDNVDQLLSMSYSDNINKLMKSNKTISEVIGDYGATIRAKMMEEQKQAKRVIPQEQPVIPEPAVIESTPVSPEYAPESPAYGPPTPTQYSPGSYYPNSPEYNPNSPEYNPNSPEYNPLPIQEQATAQATAINYSSPEYNQQATTAIADKTEIPGPAPSILEVKPEIVESPPEQSTQSESATPQTEGKKVMIIESSSSTTPETSSGVKKITI
jgi:hypothetical protein